MSTNAETFIDALRSLEERGDLAPMVRLYGEESELRNPSDTTPHRGSEGAERFWSVYRESFERIHSEFRHAVERDGVALLEWTSRGRTATGADFEYDGVSVVEFDGERIRRFRAYFDPADLTSAMSPR